MNESRTGTVSLILCRTEAEGLARVVDISRICGK